MATKTVSLSTCEFLVKMTVYTGAALYSCGTGQVLGIPCAVAAAVTGVAFGIFSLIKLSKEDLAGSLKEFKHCGFAFAIAGCFLIGMIPVFGGPLAIYCMAKTKLIDF